MQIFYTGPADRFSWVVPVDSEPTLGVGSNPVFPLLLQTTQPRFSLNWTDVGTCLPSPQPTSAATGAVAAWRPRGRGSDRHRRRPRGRRRVPGRRRPLRRRGDQLHRAPPIPSRCSTGWTREKYFVTPEGARLIEDYVRQDKYFVAIRLLSDKTTGEIQPLIMRFLGPGPCVPLKLTSIAAIRDLRVNLWVLADNRVVPDNFYEMEINPARIDWFSNGSNYEQLLKQAADQAGGQAFITEYAGPTQMLRNPVYRPGQYDLTGISTAADPPTRSTASAEQGFPRDNTLLGVLRTHIPMPDSVRAMGVQDRDFYNQLQFWWDSRKAEFKPLNAAALAADLDAKIIKPLQEAQALFDKHRKLTRLATFISPDEMNIDPTFVMNPSLPDIPATRTANAFRMCGNMEFNRCKPRCASR